MTTDPLPDWWDDDPLPDHHADDHGHADVGATDARGPALAGYITRPRWMTSAACRGKTAVMFPVRGDNRGVVKALQICAGCDVLEACRTWALEQPDGDGICGGMSARTRRKARTSS